MFSNEVGAKARGGLAAWAYFPARLKVRFQLNHCGRGQTKTKGVLQEGVSTKGGSNWKKNYCKDLCLNEMLH